MGSCAPSARLGPLMCSGAASSGDLAGMSILSLRPWQRTRAVLAVSQSLRGWLHPNFPFLYWDHEKCSQSGSRGPALGPVERLPDAPHSLLQ
eukprot:1562588-Pyramimonas_sp.AAC.1